MRKIICLLLFALAVMAQEEKPQYDLSKGEELFDKFIKDYNKEYKDEADKKVHYEEFLKSLKVINDANAAPSSATFDINAFADYTPEQRKFLHGGKIPREHQKAETETK
ncbi:uncharacterized protein LOC123871688 [Maniola jurtina]|uniref:uncharacterized protein LOC123871688 n=1 Tax=Maniola jurtina TaxID=191418 RepID=UPI001E685E28|nr:uncharacterized protein LOC123871688 [Maniola jurtina]